MNAAASRATLLVAVFALLGGYLFVFRPGEAAVADRYAQLDDARAQLEDRLASARRAVTLEQQRRDITHGLLAAGAFDDRTATVNRFLHTITAAAKTDRVAIASVSADTLERTTPAPAERGAELLEEIPMRITLRGPYARLLRLVDDVDTADSTAQMTVDSLAVADAGTNAPELAATLHVRLLRIR